MENFIFGILIHIVAQMEASDKVIDMDTDAESKSKNEAKLNDE